MPADADHRKQIMRQRAGPLPADWDAVHFMDVAAVNQRVLAEDTDADYQFRYIELSDVSEGSISLPAGKLRFAEAPSRARRLLQEGDVIVSTVRPNLRGHARIRFNPKNVVCSTGFAVITPACSDDGEYLYQALYSGAVARQLHGIVTGTGYPAVDGNDVGRLCIPYPTNPQERLPIGETLHAWDRAEAQTKELLDLKEGRSRALSQRLLSAKHRLPRCTGRWHNCRIGGLLKNVVRHVVLKDDVEYRLVSIRRRSGGLFDREPRRGRDIGYAKLKTIRTGDFVIARRQVVHGAMAMAQPEFDGAYVSDAYATLVPRPEASLHMPFFDYLSQTPLMYYKAFRCSYGVAVEKLFFDLDWFLREEVAIPPTMEEQERIASALTAADREIDLLRCELDLLRKQKRGLMQKLLTGQIRVKT